MSDFENDQRASQRFGGSGDPDDEPDTDPAVDDDGSGRGNRSGDGTPGVDEEQDRYDADGAVEGGPVADRLADVAAEYLGGDSA